MKRIIALALTLIMVFALAAPASAAKDGSVYWLNFKPELDTTAQQLAAIKALEDQGRRVPEDVSVIAIDGLEISAYTIPTLTTMVQPAEELGRTAVDMLLDIVNGSSPNRHVTLGAVLRKGESVRTLER